MKPKYLVLLALAITYPYHLVGADPQAPKPEPTSKEVVVDPTDIKDWREDRNVNNEMKDWMTEKWTADEKPYHDIRLQLEALEKANGVSIDLVAQYKREWLTKQSDTVLLYRWICAANIVYPDLVYASDHVNDSAVNDYNHITAVYQVAPLTSSYEFDREHYLYDMRIGANDPKFIDLTKRLYKRNKNDWEVLVEGAILLTSSTDVKDLQLASDMSENLAKIQPNYPHAHAISAWCHYVLWLHTKRDQDLLTARKACTNFLKTAPAKDPYRKEAVPFLKELNGYKLRGK